MADTDPTSLLCPWRCPHCRTPLQLQGRVYRCANGHCFDLAKEGYVNLLPAHRKRSATPGDDKAMLRSRRDFLQQGHYRPLAARLAALCSEFSAHRRVAAFRVLDTGCGEGYYTDAIAAALCETTPTGQLWVGGIDISKDAARMAAKRYPHLHFAVASNADLPLAAASLDCAVRIFAPPADREITRVLKPGGMFICVTPGERHLLALRRLVYDRPREHPAAVAPIEGLEHLRRDVLDFRIDVQGQGEVAKLLAMTPYYWQADRVKQAHISALERIETDVAFRIDCYGAPRNRNSP